MMRLLKVIGVAAFGLAMAEMGAFAQDYPSKPIEIVVPAAAGGGSDVLVRVLQPYLEQELGTQIVVLNIPGSGSVGGSRRVVEAAPDGYTVLANHVTLLTAMALGKADFGVEDFALSATAVGIPLVVVVPADSEIETLDDAMARAADPATPAIAGVNLGAVNHFALLMLQANDPEANFRFVQTGSGAETTAALLGHHVDIAVLAGSEAKPIVESGDVRVIAALGADRISYFPDVPTALEQGYDAEAVIEYFWLMPAGTPQDRLEKFGAALETALANSEVTAALERQGMVPNFEMGAESQSRLDAVYARLVSIAANIE